LVRIFAAALSPRDSHGISKDRPNGVKNWSFFIENFKLMIEEFFFQQNSAQP
jgi:hypothetical protein